VLDGLVCDPERPAGVEKLLDEFVPDAARTPAQRALAGLAGLLGAVLVGAAAWSLSPHVRGLGLDRLAATASWLRDHPLAPLSVLALFLAGALVFFPATLLVGATVLIYGFPRGVLLAWAGCVSAAALGYAAGRLLPRREVRGRWPAQMMWLRGQLRRRGFLAIAVARLIPVGNFSVLNLAAGSLRAPFGGFMLGNAAGVLPGILALALITDRVAEALRAPGVVNVLLLAAVIAAMASALAWLGRRLARSAPGVRPLVPAGSPTP
jgi:phospholipase D1/2